MAAAAAGLASLRALIQFDHVHMTDFEGCIGQDSNVH